MTRRRRNPGRFRRHVPPDTGPGGDAVDLVGPSTSVADSHSPTEDRLDLLVNAEPIADLDAALAHATARLHTARDRHDGAAVAWLTAWIDARLDQRLALRRVEP